MLMKATRQHVDGVVIAEVPVGGDVRRVELLRAEILVLVLGRGAAASLAITVGHVRPVTVVSHIHPPPSVRLSSRATL